MKVIIAIVLAAILANGRASPIQSGRIVGGTAARAGQYPFAASINQVTPSGNFFCGGALISNKYVLTAAHCLVDATILVINLGSIHLSSPDANRVTASSGFYVAHPYFNPDTHAADIGLVSFNIEIPYNDYIGAIVIPIIDVQVGEEVQAIGWGSISDDDSAGQEILHTVRVIALSNEECKIVYGDQINDDMVCVAGNNLEGACRGDLGGPIVQYRHNHPFHVGVSSFISGNGCETSDPSGYIRTYVYREWIRDIANVTVGPNN